MGFVNAKITNSSNGFTIAIEDGGSCFVYGVQGGVAMSFAGWTLGASGGPAPVDQSQIVSVEVASEGPQTVDISGLGSAQSFGAITIIPGGVIVGVSGLGSAQAFGVPKLNQAFSVSGLDSAQQFGLISLKFEVFGVPSAQNFGVPQNNIAFFVTGLNSAQAFGAPSVTTGGGQNVPVNGLGTAQAFGAPTLAMGGVVVMPTGLGSAQAFGVVEADQTFRPNGVPSAQAFGAPTFAFGGTVVLVSGLSSAQLLGSPNVSTPGSGGVVDYALFQRQRRRRR